MTRTLPTEAVRLALADIGRGETLANNRGAYVWSLTGRRTSGAWCAAAVHSWYEQAARSLCVLLPWQRTHGARQLAKRIRQVGSWLDAYSQPQPGDVALWRRGRRWQGHVGIVVEVCGCDFWTVEGNVGRYPAKVRRFHHRLGEPRLLGFARPPSGC